MSAAVHGYTAALLLACILLAGCHQVTEYSDSGEFGAVILRADNLEVLGYIPGMAGARSALSLGPDKFLVGCTTGYLYEVSTDSMAITASRQVTAGSGAGLDHLLLSPLEESVYAITGGGILEITLEGYGAIDEIPMGVSLSDMCVSPLELPDSLQRLYLTDSGASVIREFYAYYGEEGWVLEMPTEPRAIVDHYADPPLLLAALGDGGGICAIDLDMAVCQQKLPGSYSDVASLSFGIWDSTFCAAEPRWSEDSGRLRMGATGQVWGDPPECRSFSVPGHPVSVCASPELSLPYFYAVCADGANTVVVALDFQLQEVVSITELDGHPWDIAPHRYGEYLVVLTSI